MASWRQVLNQFVFNVEEHFDRLKYRLGERLGTQGPIIIQTYRGYGTQEKMFLKGRVLEDKGIVPSEDNDSIWENLVNMYKRFESDEIRFARLRVRFQRFEQEIQTDEEGFFQVLIKPTDPLPEDKLWHEVEVELLDPKDPEGKPVKQTGAVFVPPATARYAVISDIDDTVLKTDATDVLRMARNVFLGNARTRLPFSGVAAFYRALFQGKSGNENNPLFYVSSSPWNLYDLLTDFFQLQDIPIGPILFLRDWGIRENELLPTGHRRYKLESIDQVLSVYENMPFILIGDSGQEDPEIYHELVQRYPKRILAAYIRNVSRNLKRPEAIQKLAEEVVNAGSTLILADDTLPMAQHAYDQGWISAGSFPDIKAEKAKDEAPLSTAEKLMGEPEPAKEEPAPTVVVEHENPEVVEEAVEKGAIDTALEAGEEETESPPTVVVKGDEEDQPKAKPPQETPDK